MLAVDPAWVAVPMGGMGGMGDAGGVVLLQEAEDERRRRARDQFDALASTPGPGVTWCDGGSTPALTAFAQRSLYNDLLVLGQHDPDDALAWGVGADFVPSVIAASGKPALVVPAVVAVVRRPEVDPPGLDTHLTERAPALHRRVVPPRQGQRPR